MTTDHWSICSPTLVPEEHLRRMEYDLLDQFIARSVRRWRVKNPLLQMSAQAVVGA
jgi:hypothetical protein